MAHDGGKLCLGAASVIRRLSPGQVRMYENQLMDLEVRGEVNGLTWEINPQKVTDLLKSWDVKK